MSCRDLYEYASTVKAAYNGTTRKQPSPTISGRFH